VKGNYTILVLMVHIISPIHNCHHDLDLRRCIYMPVSFKCIDVVGFARVCALTSRLELEHCSVNLALHAGASGSRLESTGVSFYCRDIRAFVLIVAQKHCYP
jgi:hypothetical protein